MASRLARLTLLTALLFNGVTGLQSLAQKSPSYDELPDAPSASRQQDNSAQAPGEVKQDSALEILMSRSRVFPDLATSREPLSLGSKFKLFVSNSISPASFAGSLFGASISQARDTYSDYGQGGEGYAKRFGSSMARSSSRQFFGTFVFASMLHQDPRYFRIKNATLKQSVGHALRRLVVTPTDDGDEAPNYSGLMGVLAAEVLANAYLPDDDRTAGKTLKRFGKSVAVRAGTNVLKEYWPTIFKKLRNKPASAKLSAGYARSKE